MQIFLPIAEITVDPFTIIALGAMVGFLSGMFGVGGGFLMTPLLIFYGVPPAVAVGTEAVQIAGASVAGVAAHLKRKSVDVLMGAFLIAGGAIGAVVGIMIFRFFRAIGQIENFIAIAYIVFLGAIGSLMLFESVRALFREPTSARPRRRRSPAWMAAGPFAMRFRRSGLYISPIAPVAVGFIGGVLAAIMGVGGGFIMVPAMLYLLNMPTSVVVGTSLLQIMVVTSIAAMLHATLNQTVDIALALMLLIGGVIGARLGASAGRRVNAETLRALLAVIVLGVGARMLLGVAMPPESPFVIEFSA